VAAAVGRLAGLPYSLAGWAARAADLARDLGPGQVDGLLGVMVHPPDPPARVLAWDWLPHVQVAAALVLGHLGTDWDRSLRRQVLFDLANGPLDWSVTAAAVALTAAALEDPAVAPDVARLLGDLRRNLPRPGHDWYEYAIVHCQLRLPGVSPRERQELLAARAAIENKNADARGESQLRLAARLFLQRAVPPGVRDDPIAAGIIAGYVSNKFLPDIRQMLPVVLMMAGEVPPGVSGAAREYLEERARILKGIQAEIAE
jgi:hypothetical protein